MIKVNRSLVILLFWTFYLAKPLLRVCQKLSTVHVVSSSQTMTGNFNGKDDSYHTELEGFFLLFLNPLSHSWMPQNVKPNSNISSGQCARAFPSLQEGFNQCFSHLELFLSLGTRKISILRTHHKGLLILWEQQPAYFLHGHKWRYWTSVSKGNSSWL